MKTVFMGTPEFAVPCLRRLAIDTEVIGVYTQPDRRQGRGLRVSSPPVKLAAQELGLPVFQPQRIRAPQHVRQLEELGPDLIVVVAYAQILTEDILQLPPYGCINVHASLLPAYRGGAPIHWAVINGESETGVTTMLMTRELDAGDILLQAKVAIGEDETSGELHDRLAMAGADLLSQTVTAWRRKSLQPRPQLQEEASYARNLTKEDGLIDWLQSARRVHDLVRGLNPWPVAYTMRGNDRLRIWRTRPVDLDSESTHKPGCVIDVLEDGPMVQTGSGCIVLQEVQPESKKRMTGADYTRGYDLSVGCHLGG